MKKGFTLVELLAVVVLLAIVALIATPIIGNVIETSEESANQRSIEGYADAIRNEYYNQQTGGGIPVIDDAFLANIDTEGNEIKCENVLYNTDYQVVLNKCTIADYTKKLYCYAGGEHYECDDSEFLGILQNSGGGTSNNEYQDNSGANKPELANNMIPIRYNGSNWVYADTTEEWYDYDSKEWANAVVLNNGVSKSTGDTITEDEIALWYVWIPRYKYQLFNADNGSVDEQLINVTFESETATTGTVSCIDAVSGTGDSSETCTNATNGNWYTHPAFTFGDEEITGFWIGKFEVSGSTDTITIKPNVSSLRSTTVSNFFTAIKNMKTTYGLSGDSHMIKNMEWGAVAYLKQSKYGLGETDIGINNNSDFTTGCGATAGSSSSDTCEAYNTTNGMLASTTGNIYGVYDMSGGAWEYVMGNMVNSSGAFYASDLGFSSAPEAKYYDAYTYGTDNEDHGRGKLGDATKETLSSFGNYRGGWYSDFAYFVYSSSSWFVRGGGYGNSSYAGVFAFYGNNGYADSNNSARAVLIP